MEWFGSLGRSMPVPLHLSSLALPVHLPWQSQLYNCFKSLLPGKLQGGVFFIFLIYNLMQDGGCFASMDLEKGQRGQAIIFLLYKTWQPDHQKQ
jgi:hypothetical protein